MYRSFRVIDGKAKWIIVDEKGNVINKSPIKEELKDLEEEIYRKGRFANITEEELLEFIRRFYKYVGRMVSGSLFYTTTKIHK